MKVKCISCGHELNHDPRVYDDYSGPVKCLCCGSMMELKMASGVAYSINPLAVYDSESRFSA
jgi:ribosomal protein S27E